MDRPESQEFVEKVRGPILEKICTFKVNEDDPSTIISLAMISIIEKERQEMDEAVPDTEENKNGKTTLKPSLDYF